MQPITIGLTGAIGTGKSSVAKLLTELGADVVSGDDLGRIALEDSPGLVDAVKRRFGNAVFDHGGRLDRRALGRRVFTSAADVTWLTRLTFPRIHDLWRSAVKAAVAHVVVFDAALIMEWGIEREFDHLLVVAASADIARKRLTDSGRLSETEAMARQTMQMQPEQKAARADWIIRNDGSLEQLKEQVDQFWRVTIAPEIEVRLRQRAPKN